MCRTEMTSRCANSDCGNSSWPSKTRPIVSVRDPTDKPSIRAGSRQTRVPGSIFEDNFSLLALRLLETEACLQCGQRWWLDRDNGFAKTHTKIGLLRRI